MALSLFRKMVAWIWIWGVNFGEDLSFESGFGFEIGLERNRFGATQKGGLA